MFSDEELEPESQALECCGSAALYYFVRQVKPAGQHYAKCRMPTPRQHRM